MDIKSTADELFNLINIFFENNQFKLNRKSYEYKRVINNVTQIVDLSFYKESSYIAIRPEVRIKIKPIDDIYKKITSIYGRPYLTLGNHLFDIVKYMDNGYECGVRQEPLYDWIISDKYHIERLSEVIPKYLEKTILPYFNKNSSIERVDELLNKCPRDLSVHNYIYPLRANIAVIAASLNNNPMLEELLAIYEEELVDAEETYKYEFYKIKELVITK